MPVAVHCWYLKDTFTEFGRQIFEKKCFRGNLRENWQKIFVTVESGESVKKGVFATKIIFR